jgi:hypothetical protein
MIYLSGDGEQPPLHDRYVAMTGPRRRDTASTSSRNAKMPRVSRSTDGARSIIGPPAPTKEQQNRRLFTGSHIETKEQQELLAALSGLAGDAVRRPLPSLYRPTHYFISSISTDPFSFSLS